MDKREGFEPQKQSAVSIRNPKFNADGGIDCEINHPNLGWIPFTATQDDNRPLTSTVFERAQEMKPEPYVAPVIPIETIKAEFAKKVTEFATHVRIRLAGTRDPAKLAEYADKAINAQSVIDGTASADIMAEATSEAQSLGLADAAAVGEVWKAKAAQLRTLRSELNVMERAAHAAIDAAETPEAVEAATAAALQAAKERLIELGIGDLG